MTYSMGYGAWKSIKDAAMNAVALGIGITIAGLTQATAQCPELTFTAFGATITAKAILQFLNNARKNMGA
jgi:hypothetical protein